MIETLRWDVTEHLDGEKAIAAYLDAVFEDGDPALIRAAIGDVAKARGMAQIAERAGLTRADLYDALAEGAEPSFSTVANVLRALGVRLAIAT